MDKKHEEYKKSDSLWLYNDDNKFETAICASAKFIFVWILRLAFIWPVFMRKAVVPSFNGSVEYFQS